MAQAPLVAEESPQAIVRVSGFLKRYGELEAVRGVDLEVRPGEIYGLIGPDGAGKSSLMKAIAGVLTYEGGSVEGLGIRIDSEKAAERVKDRIGFMPQGLGQNLYPELSIGENIDFFAHSRLVPRSILAERKKTLLRMTRLEAFHDRPMKQLSGGMKQKLGLVCTLIHTPTLVILDEPTTGVDPVSRRDFWSILSTLLREESITALVSTAYMDEASRFQRLSLFFGGRIIGGGETDAMLDSMPATTVQVECVHQMAALERLKSAFQQVEPRGSWIRVIVDDADEERAVDRARSVVGSDEIRQVFAGRPDLDDVFFSRLREVGVVRDEQQDGTTGRHGEEEMGGPDRQASPAPEPVAVTPGAPSFTPSPSLPVPQSAPSGAVVAESQRSMSASGRSVGGLDGPAIEARGLVRSFGAFQAVCGVSFRVEAGEIFGLLGANGAGKTTVIKMLVGLLPPTAGTGFVAGVAMARAGRAIKEHVGYMSQVFSLYGDLTVAENIELYAGIYGMDRRATRRRSTWILDMAELRGVEGQRTSTLPVGLRQRLALGCALVHEPRVLFLDEPTSGVDPVGRRRFWDLLFRLSREERVSILITTHSMTEAERCDHLALMYAGRIVADASPEAMKSDLADEVGGLLEVQTDQPLPAVDALQQAGFDGVALHGRHIHLLGPDRADIKERIGEVLKRAGVRLRGVASRPLTMEDVFVTRVLALERETGGTP